MVLGHLLDARTPMGFEMESGPLSMSKWAALLPLPKLQKIFSYFCVNDLVNRVITRPQRYEIIDSRRNLFWLKKHTFSNHTLSTIVK